MITGVDDNGNPIDIEPLLNELLEGLKQKVIEFISPLLDDVNKRVTGVQGSVRGFIEGLVKELGKVVSDTWDKLYTVISEGIQPAINAVQSITESVGKSVSSILAPVVDNVGELWESVRAVVGDNINNVTAGLTQFVGDTRDNIAALIQAIIDYVEQVVGRVSAFVGEKINDAQAAAEALSVKLGELQQAAFEASLEAQRVANLALQAPLKPLADALDWVDKFLSVDNIQRWMNTAGGFPTAVEGSLNAESPGESVFSIFKQLYPDMPLIAKLAAVAFSIHQMATLPLQPVVNVWTMERMQEILAKRTPVPLSPAELAQGVVQSQRSFENSLDDAAKSGISAADFDQLVRQFGEPPGMQTLLEMWNRGFVTEEEVDLGLRESRLKNKYNEAVMKLRDYLPPVADIIRMAVREAFSPAIAERFGQYEDYPAAVSEYGRQLGLSEDWAKRYWAAHWELPSLTMGFEMLQRSIIERSDLELLMRAQDVMPFWRDKLIELSYNPLTRVDVRRMHKMGVLSEEQVFRAYLDIGYNPEKARWLTDFTVKLNTEEKKQEKAADRDLTKAEITAAYTEALVDRSSAFSMLKHMGYDDTESETVLALVDAKNTRERRKKQIDHIKKSWLSGAWPIERVHAELGALNVSGVEQEYILDEMRLEQAAKVSRPSQSQLLTFVKAGLLTLQGYADALVENGYSRFWADMFAKTAARAGNVEYEGEPIG